MNENKAIGAIIALWFFLLVLNVAFWGVIVWAIIKLVNHIA